MVTGTGPAAPAASTQKVDDYVYIHVPREKVAPVGTGSTMFLRTLGRKMPRQSFNQFRCSCRHPRRSSVFEIPAPFRTRVSLSCYVVAAAVAEVAAVVVADFSVLVRAVSSRR